MSYSIPWLKLFKPVVFVLALLPMALLVEGAINNTLGANPTETMTRTTGDWALYFLLMTLAVTPLRQLLGQGWLIRYRRMLGLFVFFYASVHFLTYVWFDQFFNVSEIVADIIKRPFITVGFLCLLLLLPLALTSTRKMVQRLKKNWKRLHQLVYVISLLAVLHYFMMTRADYLQPIIVLCILLILLAYRGFKFSKARQVNSVVGPV
ncbi:MAG: sulfite oxidase heme-binding subunit YedZ [Gammaproteobacteria bacterium]